MHSTGQDLGNQLLLPTWQGHQRSTKSSLPTIKHPTQLQCHSQVNSSWRVSTSIFYNFRYECGAGRRFLSETGEHSRWWNITCRWNKTWSMTPQLPACDWVGPLSQNHSLLILIQKCSGCLLEATRSAHREQPSGRQLGWWATHSFWGGGDVICNKDLRALIRQTCTNWHVWGISQNCRQSKQSQISLELTNSDIFVGKFQQTAPACFIFGLGWGTWLVFYIVG